MVGNIPEETTSFVGRKAELARLEHMLGACRLTTLVGTGGVGKTRLAVRAARQAAPAHRDGAWWADLSPLQGDGPLVATVCDAVGLHDHTLRMPIDALCEWLADKQLLLILDSCEHLRPSCGHLLGEILTTSPGLTVLATSRQPLDIKGEQLIEVAPLPVEGAADALTLFQDRARAADPDVTFDAPGDAEAAAEICRRLEGIPLAIELAAGGIGRHTVEQVAARIGSRFGVLTDSSLWPPRHRTLRTTIGWSHELCTPLERLLWARLTVLRGDFDEATAREVCAEGPLTEDGVVTALRGLVAKSVVKRDGGGTGCSTPSVSTGGCGSPSSARNRRRLATRLTVRRNLSDPDPSDTARPQATSSIPCRRLPGGDASPEESGVSREFPCVVVLITVKVRSDNGPYRTPEPQMPQITVDYSAELDDAFDRRGFAQALHPLVAETVTTKIAACKTRFRRVDESVVADAATGDAILHISIGLLPGRTDEIKAQLTESVLELLTAHLKDADGLTVHASAETRDLDPSYRKR